VSFLFLPACDAKSIWNCDSYFRIFL
jgi:hypothetical protein